MNPSHVKYEIVHRCSLALLAKGNPNPVPDKELNAEKLIEAFYNKDLGTGGRTPYHFLIVSSGEIEQMLPLSVRGSHARGYNWRSIGIAVVGNTDQRPMGYSQWDSLKWLCLVLGRLNGGLLAAGHTELPGASGDPNKHCPGKYLAVDELKRLVDQQNAFLPEGYDYWNFAEKHGIVI